MKMTELINSNGHEPMEMNKHLETDNHNTNFDLNLNLAQTLETDTPDFAFGFNEQSSGDVKAFSRMETPAEAAFARTKLEEDTVLRCIQQAMAIHSPTVDLSRKRLLAIPEELMQMEDLEFLYLEGNEISFLPDDFFQKLPRLKWLDLRNNHLTRIPSIFLAGHTALRNLLLQNNRLKSLPLELGQVRTLHGLNIINNPLEFPPNEIIERGTYEIQKFLREMLQAKSSELALDCIFEDGDDSSGSDDWNTSASMMDLARNRHPNKSTSADQLSTTTDSTSTRPSPAAGRAPVSAEVQRQLEQRQIQQAQSSKERLERFRSLNASNTAPNSSLSRKQPTSVMSWKVNLNPEPPDQHYIHFKMAEARELTKVKERKQKTDAILQRRKDDSLLKNWRDEGKKLQARKQRQTFVKGTTDYPETAEEAPFAVDKPFMKMLDNAERFKNTREKPRRALSPATKARMEEEKEGKIRDLERRIKAHTASMAERRRKPKGTPQEEMAAAQRELQIAESLHRQLMNRQHNAGRRLKDFEAEIVRQQPVGTRLKH